LKNSNILTRIFLIQITIPDLPAINSSIESADVPESFRF